MLPSLQPINFTIPQILLLAASSLALRIAAPSAGHGVVVGNVLMTDRYVVAEPVVGAVEVAGDVAVFLEVSTVAVVVAVNAE